MPKSRPVVIIFSILAALDIITATAGLNDMIGVKVAFFLIMATKAIQAGMTFYVQNIVVPVVDVAAYRSDTQGVIAGPAAAATDGTPVVVTEAA